MTAHAGTLAPASDGVAGLISAGAAVAFREVGPVELKGVSGAMRLHAAHRPG